MLDEQNKILPSDFAIGVFFVNKNYDFESEMLKICAQHSLEILGTRILKTDSKILGKEAANSMPNILQLFVKSKNQKVELEAALLKQRNIVIRISMQKDKVTVLVFQAKQ